MNIIFPINGLGIRFKNDGYTQPKPLINVFGESMILWVLNNLNIDNRDIIHIVYNTLLDDYSFTEKLKKELPDYNFNFIKINKNTNGAVETIRYGLYFINNNDNTLLLDCDTFYVDDIISAYKNNDVKNNIFYFNTTEELPIFSYININKYGELTDIKEKEKISSLANTGAYGFESVELLKEYCDRLLNSNIKGELYISLLYQQMLIDGVKIQTTKVENVQFLGTPNQLRDFLVKNKPRKIKRICFDLDNTLVSYPTIKGDYSSVLPKEKNIKLLRFLKSMGFTIIIHTARRMKTNNGNVAKVISDISKITFETLEKFNIPFDEIYFGKPYADFYIDDLGVNAFSDIEKEIGIINYNIEPRVFNKINIEDEKIIKETNNLGEIYFYKNIPEELKELFPCVYEITQNKITLERVKLETLSDFLINKRLTSDDLCRLYKTIYKFHSITPNNELIEINHTIKITDRFISNDYSLYQYSNETYNEIVNELQPHKHQPKIGVIHGDCVFTNIFYNKDLHIFKFIDMRGNVDGKHTIYGDIFYDFAKIYQSLCGYDFILRDMAVDYDYINLLKEYFEKLIMDNFDITGVSYMKSLTKSLLFSLLPLHNDESKKQKYYNLIFTIK